MAFNYSYIKLYTRIIKLDEYIRECVCVKFGLFTEEKETIEAEPVGCERSVTNIPRAEATHRRFISTDRNVGEQSISVGVYL